MVIASGSGIRLGIGILPDAQNVFLPERHASMSKRSISTSTTTEAVTLLPRASESKGAKPTADNNECRADFTYANVSASSLSVPPCPPQLKPSEDPWEVLGPEFHLPTGLSDNWAEWLYAAAENDDMVHAAFGIDEPPAPSLLNAMEMNLACYSSGAYLLQGMFSEQFFDDECRARDKDLARP